MRVSLTLLLLVVLLAGSGCSRAERPPRTGIPDSLMVRALIEAHAAGARAARTGEDADSLRAEAFAPLGIDTTTFAQALDAYAERPQALLRLYDQAIARMTAEQARLGRSSPPPPDDTPSPG